MAHAYEYIPGRFGYTLERTGEVAVAGRVPCEASLVDEEGHLRTAAMLMAVDMTCGMAAGLAVLPKWTVTADADVHFVAPCGRGPLRVDAVNVRAGRTMSVVEATVVDEGANDRLVAVVTANHGVLDSSFDHWLAQAEIGDVQTFARPPTSDASLEQYFRLGRDDHEIVSLALDERTTNPWGILHGGLHGLLVDTAAASVGIATPTHVGLRFLNSVKEGPAVARVTDVVDRTSDRIARVEVRDAASGRLAVIGRVTGR